MTILILSLALLLILGYTIYALTKKDTLYAEAQDMAHTMTMAKLKSADQNIGVVLWTCFISGTLLTGVFAVQFFAGADDPSTFTTSQTIYAAIGCSLTLSITMAQKSLYSSIHTTKAGLLITFLILLFVIFSEVATSSERTDMLVKHRSENSQVYQGVVGSINAPTAPSNVNTRGLANAQAEAAKAQVEIEACSRHASKGQARVDKCLRIERGNLAAAEGKIAAIQGQNQFNAEAAMKMKMAMVDKAKDLQYDEDQNPAIIKFLKALFGGEILFSMILASLIVVVAFEAAFHFTGTRRAVIRHAILLKQGIDDEVNHPAPLPEKKNDLNQWNNELKKSGIDSPADPAMNQQADQDQIERIIQRGKQTTPATPEQTRNEATPATPDYLKGSKGSEIAALYPVWISAVLDGSEKVSESGFSGFVNKHVDSKKLGFNKVRLAEVWQKFGDKAVAQGKLEINPDYAPGNRKQKYVIADKYQKGNLGTQEQQLQMV